MDEKISDKIKELHHQGLEAYDRNDLDVARKFFKELDALNPRMADVLNRLGIIANMAGDLDEAVEYFQRAVAINPSYTEAALNLTITYNELGETEKAFQVFKKVSSTDEVKEGKLDPFAAGKLANEHYRVGGLYLQFNLLDEAIAEFRKALGLKAELPDVLTQMGSALREKGELGEAVDAFTRALEINPRFGQASVELGLAQFSLGSLIEARQTWQKALEYDPELIGAKTLLHLYKDEEQGG